MTHIENPVIWKLFFLVSGLSVTAFCVAVIGREAIWRPRDSFDRAFQNAFRALGASAFTSVLIFCYAVTERCVTAENQCEQFKAIAAAKAKGVDNDLVAEVSVDTGECKISWLANQRAFTAFPVSGGDSSGRGSGPLPGSFRGQREREDAGIQCSSGGFEMGRGGLHELPTGTRAGQHYH